MKNIFVASILFFFVSPSLAAPPLNYTTRTRDFSGWTPASRGDIITVGMATATVATPSSIASAEVNPAGFAMMAASLSAQINSLDIEDPRVQKSGESINSKQVGIAVCPPPWGFGFAYYSPMRESGNYLFSNSGANRHTEVGIEEYRFILARSLLINSRLSLGTSLRLMHATREVGFTNYNATNVSYNLGALYKLHDRVILGMSYSPGVAIGPNENTPDSVDLPGFNRTVRMPSQFVVGASWIPNRFFKAGFSLHRTGSTENTALLGDQSKITGANATVEPRLGGSYVFAEFLNFRSEFSMGTYYETARILGEADRLHLTVGLEANPYFVNTGIGMDVSKDYRNFMVFVGINVISTLRTFDIIPKDPVTPVNRFWPKPFEVKADGLAPGLAAGEPTSVKQPSLSDVNKIVRDIPKKISEKFGGDDEKEGKKK